MEHVQWKVIEVTVRRLVVPRPNDRYRFDDADIALAVLWACYHDKPAAWACRRSSWPVYHRRPLPSPSTLCRRQRRASVQALLEAVRCVLEQAGPPGLVHIIDGKILPVAKHTADRQATRGGPDGRHRGYRLDSIVTPDGLRRAWEVSPLHIDEKIVARELLVRAGVQGYILGDSNYHSDPLCRIGTQQDLQLVAPRKKPGRGLGHHPISRARRRCLAMVELSPTAFSRDLFSVRQRIEAMHAHLGCFGGGLKGLPSWVRGLDRVRRWVLAKLVLDAARRDWKRRATAA
jgi:hypothetical protein